MKTASAYPTYIESGLPWIPNVPNHWTVVRAKNMASLIQTGPFGLQLHNHDYVSGGTPVINPLHLISGLIRPNAKARVSEDKVEELSRHKLKRGDIVFARRGDLGRSAVVTEKEEGWLCGTGSVLFRPIAEVIHPEFLSRLIETPMYKGLLAASSVGSTMANLNPTTFSVLRVVQPPRPEQDQIVAYLRAQDAHIARFIKAKRDLIGLLNEQKLRIIDHAVTRGLDASVALKPSGIEWLGDVPKHWQVQRLKWVCRFAYGDSLSDAVRREGTVPVYGSNGQVGLHDSANSIGPCIVIGRKGSFGKVNYSDRDVFAIDTTFYVDRTCSKANIRWLYYILVWCRLDRISKDSAVPGLDRTDAYNTFVPVCDLAEQERIAVQLDKDTAAVDVTITRVEEEIKLIREYRDRLIADVVTGQVDVRDWVPGPDDGVAEEDLGLLAGDEEMEPDGEDDGGEES